MKHLTEVLVCKAIKNTDAVALAAAKLAKSSKKQKKKAAAKGEGPSFSADPFPVTLSEHCRKQMQIVGGPVIPDGKILPVQATAEIRYNVKTGELIEEEDFLAEREGEEDPDVRTIRGFHIERPANQRREWLRMSDGSTALVTYRKNGWYLVEIFSPEETLGFMLSGRQNEMCPVFTPM